MIIIIATGLASSVKLSPGPLIDSPASFLLHADRDQSILKSWEIWG